MIIENSGIDPSIVITAKNREKLFFGTDLEIAEAIFSIVKTDRELRGKEMNKNSKQAVEVIERWERKNDGTVEIAYSYDGGKTYKIKGIANELKSPTNKDSVSLCSLCYCMTHTVDNKCGKCGASKHSTDELERILTHFYFEQRAQHQNALSEAKQAIEAHYARQEAEIRLNEITDVLYGYSRTYKQTVTDSAGNVYVDESHGFISKYEVQERISELKAQLTSQAEQERKKHG